MNALFKCYPLWCAYVMCCIAKAFMWQLEAYPEVPENDDDLNVALVFELTLTAMQDNDPCSKWHCAFIDYKGLQERYKHSKLAAHKEGFNNEGHIPGNNTEFMGCMLPIVRNCPDNHVTAFYWDLRMGTLIEYEYICYG